MIQVKICGITNVEDALCAEQNGAAAVGFIFYSPSLRYIPPGEARNIIDRLPASLVRVGVFVNEEEREVKRIFDYCGLDMVQFHGDESPDYCRRFPAGRIIKALELRKTDDLQAANCFDVAAILVDSRSGALYGGTGRKSNWELARLIAKPLILSGGLNAGNVTDALSAVNPAAVDINSGVEERPGKKDAAKIRDVMQKIGAAAASIAVPPVFVGRNGDEDTTG